MTMTAPSNVERLIGIAETVFDTRHDPSQLSITEDVMRRLKAIHPATMGERTVNGDPVAWTIVIPTTASLMAGFLLGRISEAQLFERTDVGGKFQSIYLCSALVLPEHRTQGVARSLMQSSIEAIRADHAITSLYSWAFNPEGSLLAAAVGRAAGLPLFNRTLEHKRRK